MFVKKNEVLEVRFCQLFTFAGFKVWNFLVRPNPSLVHRKVSSQGYIHLVRKVQLLFFLVMLLAMAVEGRHLGR